MALVVVPPVQPMLAKLARELPKGAFIYEPKWDGFRCVVFRDVDSVDMRSRNQRPLARYFPEVIAGVRALPLDRFVLDGEIVTTDGDFEALMLRLHPAASRVERLARETPACFVAFDVLAIGDEDVRSYPITERRARLEQLLTNADRIRLTPATTDSALAQRWLDDPPPGCDGVVAKPLDLRYQQGKRAMIKVKRERTIDAVVAGARAFDDGSVASLLLGLYDGGVLRSIGVTSAFSARQRVDLLPEIAPLIVPIDQHPWAHGYNLDASPVGRLAGSAGRWQPGMALDWIPLRPERVAEVGVTQIDRGRLRYPARWRRWRPDKTPGECTLDQLEPAHV
jgi:ATP-dependent DNA ligase